MFPLNAAQIISFQHSKISVFKSVEVL